MKRILWMSALVLLAAATASAQFEGIADFKVTMGGTHGKATSGEGKIFIAPGVYRMDWNMSHGTKAQQSPDAPPRVTMTMLTRKAEPGQVYMLNEERKTYFVFNSKKAAEQAARMPPETFTVKKLGTEKVAGFSCSNALLTSSSGSEIEVCIAKDLAASSDFLAAMDRRQADAASWLTALKAQGIEGFPIRWVIRKKGSTEALASMEITKIEKKALSASLFELPAGYTEASVAVGGLTPEQEKARADAQAHMNEALAKMTPEQRKAYEEAMRRNARPTPVPRP